MVAGKVVATTVSVSEEHKTEEVHDEPQSHKAALTAPDVDIAVPAVLPILDTTPQPDDEREIETTPAVTTSDEPLESKPPPLPTPERLTPAAKEPVVKSPSSQKEKSKTGKFSLFGKKKKKMPSESSSFEGKLEQLDDVEDHGTKKHKLQKRFSFGGKSGSKPGGRKSEGENKEETAKSSSGFKFFTLRRNKPKECVRVSADAFQETPVNRVAASPSDEQQEVFAVEGGGQIVVKTTDGSPGRPTSEGGIVADDVFDEYPVLPTGQHLVVVAIDFGTTFSGYAFSFVHEVEEAGDESSTPVGSIHMMRRWEGGDPGVVNQKTPTTLLLTPNGQFHSFGFTARNFYHDLDPTEAQRWPYFEKFKMTLHNNAYLTLYSTV